jgi:hypothetical protein
VEADVPIQGLVDFLPRSADVLGTGQPVAIGRIAKLVEKGGGNCAGNMEDKPSDPAVRARRNDLEAQR